MTALLTPAEITARTYRFERWRALSAGVLETAGNTFLLLIAVRWFHAGATEKALVASSGSLGLMLSPAVVSWVARSGMTASRAASLLSRAGAFVFLLMAMVPHIHLFAVGSVLAMTASSAAIPLLTHIYHENYPSGLRGSLFSKSFMIRIGTAALFSELAGRTLSHHLSYFRLLLVLFAAAFAFAGYCLSRCPSTALSSSEGAHPFRSLRYAREDPLFRRTLICWMLMGFANLMMNPMRVEFLANPKYGLLLAVSEVAFLTGVVPNLARLVLSPVWGWLFDRMNFFTLRVALNLGFALGILTFFTSHSMTGLVAGSIIYGIANAGGDVAWSLWVTKFAPPDRVADYMSVHTCFTGLRGILAPLAAFHLVKTHSLGALGLFSAVLIVLASLLLVPEIKFGRKVAPGDPAVEEVPD